MDQVPQRVSAWLTPFIPVEVRPLVVRRSVRDSVSWGTALSRCSQKRLLLNPFRLRQDCENEEDDEEYLRPLP